MSHERPLSVARYCFPQFEVRRIQWFERLRWFHDADAISRLCPLFFCYRCGGICCPVVVVSKFGNMCAIGRATSEQEVGILL